MATLARVLAEAFQVLHRSRIVSTNERSWRPPRPQHSCARPTAAATRSPTPLQLLGVEGVLADPGGTECCR